MSIERALILFFFSLFLSIDLFLTSLVLLCIHPLSTVLFFHSEQSISRGRFLLQNGLCRAPAIVPRGVTDVSFLPQRATSFAISSFLLSSLPFRILFFSRPLRACFFSTPVHEYKDLEDLSRCNGCLDNAELYFNFDEQFEFPCLVHLFFDDR